MTVNNNETRPNSSIRLARRLRIAGVLVLMLGIGGAWWIRWQGTRWPDLMEDPSMVGFDRAQTRQMGRLYGKMGLAIEQLSDDLKQPGTQAKIILVASILVAVGCFYFASSMDHGDQPADGTESPHGG